MASSILLVNILCALGYGCLGWVAPDGVLLAIGFAGNGVTKLSFATILQRRCKGVVPKDGLFCQMQRLGAKGFPVIVKVPCAILGAILGYFYN